MRSLTRYAWFVLALNVTVILMGALVRATGSGAGCGRSWPTCDGRVVPELEGATAVEFAHRGVSGIALIAVALLVFMVWRRTARGDPARVGAVMSLFAIVLEALIGAMIVLAEWVADDASVARAISVPLHLVNTLFLLAALTLTIHWLSGGGRLDLRRNPTTTRAVIAGGLALVVIAATGAITALADTLFPKVPGADLSAQEHFLTDLRLVHPVVAILSVAVAWWLASRSGRSDSRSVSVFYWVVSAMLFSGALNVLLGVPVWMQLVHLLLADILWIAYVFLSAAALQEPAATESRLSPSR